MKKKTIEAPKLSDLATHEFDTSKYLKIKSTVTRDNDTGAFTLKPVNQKPRSE